MIRSRRVSKYGAAVTSNAPAPSCTNDRNTASNASSLLALVMTIRCPIARAASSICCSWSAAGGKPGLMSTPIRATPGTRSRSNPSRFGSIRLVNRVTPVTLPPGRLKLSTKPALTGSPPIPTTIGIVVVAAFAASPEGSPPGCHDDGDLPAHQIGGERRQAAIVAECPAELGRYVFTLGEAALLQATAECFEPVYGILRRARAHKPDHRHRALLRSRSKRPSGYCSAGEGDECAAIHWPVAPVLPTERIAHLSLRQETAALRDFGSA